MNNAYNADFFMHDLLRSTPHRHTSSPCEVSQHDDDAGERLTQCSSLAILGTAVSPRMGCTLARSACYSGTPSNETLASSDSQWPSNRTSPLAEEDGCYSPDHRRVSGSHRMNHTFSLSRNRQSHVRSCNRAKLSAGSLWSSYLHLSET